MRTKIYVDLIATDEELALQALLSHIEKIESAPAIDDPPVRLLPRDAPFPPTAPLSRSSARTGAHELSAEQVLAVAPRRSVASHDAIFSPPGLGRDTIPRLSVLAEIRKQLLVDRSTDGQPPIVTLLGPGGVGKTTLARMVCNDRSVKARFTDGTLWITLGQRPEILGRLNVWLTALPGPIRSFSDAQSAHTHIAREVAELRLLFVIDDVWSVSDLQPFIVAGFASAVLITTREGRVANVSGQHIAKVKLLEDEEAIALIKLRAGSLPASESELLTLGRLLENRPPALELASHQLASGFPVAALLADLQNEMSRLDALEYRSVAEEPDPEIAKNFSLHACFNLSLRQLSWKVLHSWATLAILHPTSSFGIKTAARLWSCSVLEARRRLLELFDRSLLQKSEVVDSLGPHFRLHSLIRLKALQILTSPPEAGDTIGLPCFGKTVTGAHRDFLEGYRGNPPVRSWHQMEDDPYVTSNLVYHLRQSAAFEDLCALLTTGSEDSQTGRCRNAWYARRRQDGSEIGFLFDLSEILSEIRVRAEASPRSVVGPLAYCALMLSSMNAQGREIGDQLTLALVDAGVWTDLHALAHARRHLSIEGLARVAARTIEPQRNEGFSLALERAGALVSPRDRARALLSAAAPIPASERDIMLNDAAAIVNECTPEMGSSLAEDADWLNLISSLIQLSPPETAHAFIHVIETLLLSLQDLTPVRLRNDLDFLDKSLEFGTYVRMLKSLLILCVTDCEYLRRVLRRALSSVVDQQTRTRNYYGAFLSQLIECERDVASLVDPSLLVRSFDFWENRFYKHKDIYTLRVRQPDDRAFGAALAALECFDPEQLMLASLDLRNDVFVDGLFPVAARRLVEVKGETALIDMLRANANTLSLANWLEDEQAPAKMILSIIEREKSASKWLARLFASPLLTHSYRRSRFLVLVSTIPDERIRADIVVAVAPALEPSEIGVAEEICGSFRHHASAARGWLALAGRSSGRRQLQLTELGLVHLCLSWHREEALENALYAVERLTNDPRRRVLETAAELAQEIDDAGGMREAFAIVAGVIDSDWQREKLEEPFWYDPDTMPMQAPLPPVPFYRSLVEYHPGKYLTEDVAVDWPTSLSMLNESQLLQLFTKFVLESERALPRSLYARGIAFLAQEFAIRGDRDSARAIALAIRDVARWWP